MKTKEKVYPIQIHFKGKNLDMRSVPIYELGESLLAIQRIVQRAYLIVSENDQQRRIQRIATRENLALQIVKQEKGSDVYIFDWFIKTVSMIPPEVIAKMLELIFTVGMTFVTEQVIKRNGLDRKVSLLLDDFHILSNRIGSVGKIEEIELRIKNKKTSILFTKRTKEYISRVREETVIRKDLHFLGTVKTVHIDSGQFVDVMPDKFSHKVKVTVANPDDFDMILETTAVNKKAVYKFNGFTQVKPGEDPIYFETFIANQITPYRGRRKRGKLTGKKKQGKVKKQAAKQLKAKHGKVKRRSK